MQHLQEIPISISCEPAKFECTVSSYGEMFLALESSCQYIIKQLDYTILQLLVNFIYSGKILLTEKNLQVLIPAANLLQLNDVNKTCCAFLQKQLHPENCLGIKAYADLHSCSKLLTSSEFYIQQNLTEAVDADKFLSLSS